MRRRSFVPQAQFADAPEEWRDGERYATEEEALLWNGHLIRSRDDVIATRVVRSDSEPTAKFHPNRRRK